MNKLFSRSRMPQIEQSQFLIVECFKGCVMGELGIELLAGPFYSESLTCGYCPFQLGKDDDPAGDILKDRLQRY